MPLTATSLKVTLTARHRSRAWTVFQSAVFLPPTEGLDKWTEQYARLSSEGSNETGRLDWSRAPYQREIMQVLSNPRHKRVVIMASSQIGKTHMILCFIGFIIHKDPGPILLVEPTLGTALKVAKNRIEPMLRDTPVLRPLVRDYRGIQANRKAQSSSRLDKSFRGGHLSIVGSNAVPGVSTQPIRYLIVDEADRVRNPGVSKGRAFEGDILLLGEKRTNTYTYNKKIVYISSPGNKGSSRIEWEFLRSDQRHPYVPCPHCDHWQVLQFENFGVDKLDSGYSIIESAHFVCVSCGKRITQEHKHKMLQHMLDPQCWRAHRPESKVPGFWIWEAYSTWRTWPEIAADHAAKLAGGDEAYQVFVNTVLAKTFEQKGDAPTMEIMRGLVEPYEQWTIPPGVMFLTIGADVQGDRVEASVWGWGKGEEAWLIGHKVLYGSAQNSTTWLQVHNLLQSSWIQPSTGRSMRAWMACIDSGYETQSVYAFCRGKENVRPTKGSANLQDPALLAPSLQDIDYEGGRIEGGIQLWRLGVGQIKIVLYSRMKLQPKEGEPRRGDKFIHLPAGLKDSDLHQLSSEQLMREPNRSGFLRERWVKKYDNEWLDCLVNAYGAAMMLGLDQLNWSEVEQILTLQQKQTGRTVN